MYCITLTCQKFNRNILSGTGTNSQLNFSSYFTIFVTVGEEVSGENIFI